VEEKFLRGTNKIVAVELSGWISKIGKWCRSRARALPSYGFRVIYIRLVHFNRMGSSYSIAPD
jgi:hypothetical protein